LRGACFQPESGRHSFGLYMNDLLLDYYRVEREVSWADQLITQ
jgi:hypothetical protein